MQTRPAFFEAICNDFASFGLRDQAADRSGQGGLFTLTASTCFAHRRNWRPQIMLSRYLLIGASALALILPGAAALAAGNSSPPENARPAAPASAKEWRGAEALLRQYLAERERTLGNENPFTLLTAASLALVYKAEGRYAEAARLYSRTLDESAHTGRKQCLHAANGQSLGEGSSSR
jgi:hypothetical protein